MLHCNSSTLLKASPCLTQGEISITDFQIQDKQQIKFSLRTKYCLRLYVLTAVKVAFCPTLRF